MPVNTETKQKIFSALKKIILGYCPPLVKQSESETGCQVMGNVKTTYGYNKAAVPGMYFASAAIRKNSVAFYFFPIYGAPKEFGGMAPNTMKCLKGKTCFHFTKEEHVDETELNALFAKGLAIYRREGWVR